MFARIGQHTLKNISSTILCSDAIEEPFLVPQSQRLFKEPSLPYPFIIFQHKEPFVKRKASSDVKGSMEPIS